MLQRTDNSGPAEYRETEYETKSIEVLDYVGSGSICRIGVNSAQNSNSSTGQMKQGGSEVGKASESMGRNVRCDGSPKAANTLGNTWGLPVSIGRGTKGLSDAYFHKAGVLPVQQPRDDNIGGQAISCDRILPPRALD